MARTAAMATPCPRACFKGAKVPRRRVVHPREKLESIDAFRVVPTRVARLGLRHWKSPKCTEIVPKIRPVSWREQLRKTRGADSGDARAASSFSAHVQVRRRRRLQGGR